MRMIIGRWLTSLNSSRTMRCFRRRDDNSRKKVQNVRGDSSVIYLGSEVTNDAIDEGFNKHFHPGKTHVERRLLIEPSPAPESTYS
jgi:hypothetical protein